MNTTSIILCVVAETINSSDGMSGVVGIGVDESFDATAYTIRLNARIVGKPGLYCIKKAITKYELYTSVMSTEHLIQTVVEDMSCELERAKKLEPLLNVTEEEWGIT